MPNPLSRIRSMQTTRIRRRVPQSVLEALQVVGCLLPGSCVVLEEPKMGVGQCRDQFFKVSELHYVAQMPSLGPTSRYDYLKSGI